MFRTIQIAFFVLGILFILGADRLGMQFLTYAGMACFGLAAMAIGWEAIIRRQIQLGRHRSGNLQTYSGFPAVLQGIQFNLIGLFLVGVAALTYFNNGREVFLQFVRRPGVPLTVIGGLILLQSLVMFLGYREVNDGSGVTPNLVISRLLPGLILAVLGLGALGLGLFEIAAPNAFDAMGGGFLEVLYEVER
jgi:hypothetical protein